VVQISDHPCRVDEARMRGVRGFDPFARVFDVALETDRDDHEAEGSEFLVQFLPDRQVISAPSPRGPGGEKDLLATVLGQRMCAPVEIGQGEVGRLEKREARRTVVRADTDERCCGLDVDRTRTLEQRRQPSEVEQAIIVFDAGE
jgi:hypothetical protein